MKSYPFLHDTDLQKGTIVLSPKFLLDSCCLEEMKIFIMKDCKPYQILRCYIENCEVVFENKNCYNNLRDVIFSQDCHIVNNSMTWIDTITKEQSC